MTCGNDPAFVEPIVAMMMDSREAVVDYMTPLGLAHLMATGHHYGPGPWISDLARPDWNPVYYHRADADGIGFDRTATGTNVAGAICAAGARRSWGNLATVGDDYLLWFHHVPWDHRLSNGRTLWDELVIRYTDGVARVGGMRRTWAALAPADRRRALRRGRRLPRHPGGRGAVVARRLDRLFPEPVAPAAAGRSRGAGARSRLLSGDPDAACAGGYGVRVIASGPFRAGLMRGIK